MLIPAVIAAVCLTAWFALRKVIDEWRTNPKSLPYPPGPPQKWFIGNLSEMPVPTNFDSLLKWRKQYGEVTFFRALGQSVLVLNSLKAATDLLGKRGIIYAHRPQLVVAGELMGLNKGIAMMEYNPRQRLFRRLAHRSLGPDSIKRFEFMLQRHTILLVNELLSKPDEFEALIRLASARNILSISYGLDIRSSNSEYIVEAEKIMSLIERSTEPGVFLADFLPILKYVPAWAPFASFKRLAEQGRREIDEFIKRPFEFVKEEMRRGMAGPSLVHDMLLEKDHLLKEDEKEHVIMNLFGGLYGAATATSTATMLTFIMLMALHPEKQSIAQAEIDNVTEGQRLPNFSDRERLPYVVALMKEVMRWHAVVPLGLARRTQTADGYNGYFIPADTIVLYNLWAIGRSEGTSCSLEDFAPERYLDGKETVDPHDYVFGFGRRVCPGRFLADSALFSILSSILACFTISKLWQQNLDSPPNAQYGDTRVQGLMIGDVKVGTRGRTPST